ncbi:protein CgeB [Fictibacillus macauensis ZFHKF-1]|uniref:Protein CgeB n=1 Tax=Fictibacillus macauensis ZFHKF-1 TaxID=1196324 RepID=I8AGU4_9BACL|nr:glycosyltransferase [Fictibacillus macauensis]EIT84634.1 protein CgeB [Fictibacillus macauensis ZFHKF-1]
MRIFYIPSGFPRIYHHIDRCIIQSLRACGHTVTWGSHFKGIGPLTFMIHRFQPHVVLTTVGFLLPEELLSWLEEKQIHRAIWFTEDPHYMDTTVTLASRYDVVFSIEENAVNEYKKRGHLHAYHVPLAADVHTFVPSQEEIKKEFDLCLIGYPYENRKQLISHILEHTTYSIFLGGDEWRQFFGQEKHQARVTIEPYIAPKDTVSYFHRSSIILNPQRPHDLSMNENTLNIEAYNVNNRTFDLAACQAFQLLSYRDRLPFGMKEHTHLALYKNEEDCLKKIDYYLQRPKARQKLCQAAYDTIQSFHTYKHRAETISTILSTAYSLVEQDSLF